MRTNGYGFDMYNLFMQNIVKYDRKENYIKSSIASTTSRITKSLLIHQLAKRRVKEINDRNDPVLDIIHHFFHEPSKIQVAFCRCNPLGNYYFCRHRE